MQLTREKWDKVEPENLQIASQKPRALKRMAEVLHGFPINPGNVANYNLSPMSLVGEILDAHADKSDLHKVRLKKSIPDKNTFQQKLRTRRGHLS